MENSLKLQVLVLMNQGASYGVIRDYYYQSRSCQSETFAQGDQILRQLQQLHKEIRAKNLTLQNQYMTEDLANWYQASLLIDEDGFPELWREIPNPPILIFYRGDLELLKTPMVSMIGSRKISPYGKKMAQELTMCLVNEGITTVSGLAAGVDTHIHETSILYQGRTIGIIPGGLDYYYPYENRQLQQEMGRSQLLLSEYLPHHQLSKLQFIMRNRLVAGLTRATTIVQGTRKSGSLITANYALQYDRQVFALVGNIDDDHSTGCNDLVYSGATPIISLEQYSKDIRELLETQDS